jgi:Zn-dependent peptidase ImmA (M78 family)
MINKQYYELSPLDEDIIKKYHNKFPVSLSSIANELNIKIYEGDLSVLASGQITKKNNGVYEIIVQKNQSSKRQRFTAAHELSHFFLHKDIMGNGVADNTMYRSHLSNKQETEANKLAADILMPMSEVNKKLDEGLSIDDLSSYFGVSQQAIKVRLGIPF